MDKIFPSDGNDVSSILTLNTILYFFSLYDNMVLCRYSIVAIQVLGKDQRQVQFLLSAPLTNLFELFELLDRYQSEMIDFFVL